MGGPIKYGGTEKIYGGTNMGGTNFGWGTSEKFAGWREFPIPNISPLRETLLLHIKNVKNNGGLKK